MASNFEWQTDDDAGWDHEPESPPPTESPNRRWFTLSGIALVVMLAGWLGWRQFNQRIQTTTAAVEADLRASYMLVQETGRRGDMEVFGTLLSGRDPAWTAAQRDLVEASMWRNLGPLGLLPSSATPTIQTIELSPDLAEAEITGRFTYTIEIGHGLTDTVALDVTEIYRRGATRWLFAPPPAEFWGAPLTINGPNIQLKGSLRDETLLLRLLQSLENTLAQVCNSDPDLGCQSAMQLTITMDNNPASLTQLQSPADLLTGELNLHLPAPSLVGYPTNEAAFEALARGYGRLMTAGLTAHQLGYSCCRQINFFMAVNDWRLVAVGRWPQPMGPADYTTLFRSQWQLSEGTRLWFDTVWYQTQPETDQAYATIELLPHIAPALGPSALQSLMGSATLDFNSWFQQLLADRLTFQETWLLDPANHWLQSFLFQQGALQQAQAPPPIPFPAETLALNCHDLAGPQLWRYDLVTGDWTPFEEQPPGQVSFVMGLPDYSGLWLVSDQNNRQQITLYRDGAFYPVSNDDLLTSGYGWFGNATPDAQKLVVSVPAADGSLSRFELGLLDVNACQAGDCSLQLIDGLPTWSPAGQYTLLNGLDGGLYLGDKDGQSIRLIDENGSAFGFWLDNERFGWARPGEEFSPSFEIMVGRPDETTVTRLLSSAELAAATQDNILNTNYLSIWAAINPHHPDELLIDTNFFYAPHRDYLLTYSLTTGQIEVAYSLEGDLYVPWFADSALSAGQESLVMQARLRENGDERPQNYHLVIYHLEQGEISTLDMGYEYYQPSWSRDRRWLALAGPGFVNLVAPDYGYTYPIPPQHFFCDFAGWIDEQ